MNIQIFGKKKCHDTKKAERFFKERRIKYQRIDILSKGISAGELKSVIQSIGLEPLINTNSPYYQESLLEYTSDIERKKELLLEYTEVLNTPIVRNGKKATLGYQPDIWKDWN